MTMEDVIEEAGVGDGGICALLGKYHMQRFGYKVSILYGCIFTCLMRASTNVLSGDVASSGLALAEFIEGQQHYR